MGMGAAEGFTHVSGGTHSTRANLVVVFASHALERHVGIAA